MNERLLVRTNVLLVGFVTLMPMLSAMAGEARTADAGHHRAGASHAMEKLDRQLGGLFAALPDGPMPICGSSCTA